VKAFLARGVPINTQTRNGTALHGAAVEGDLEMIEYLIQQGADVNAINAYGDSPLANAMGARSRAQETQALLIKHGAKLVRGTEEQRNRLIEEQVHQDIEEEHRRNQSK
jgi:ankyrin repeat protein